MRDDIHSAEALEALYGCSLRQAIPVDRHGDVPRIAVLQELNPDAPAIILCSAAVERGAKLLMETKAIVPVYVRLHANQWVEQGLFRATSLDHTRAALRHAEDMTGRWDVNNHGPLWGILSLEFSD